MLLAREPVDIQRTVIGIFSVLKSIVNNTNFAEYVHRKYPELDEDVITMIEDLIERAAKI